ncbi:DUF2218 domain-containing protein [Sphaerisporangium perillae]|uniref:DUF2218 domain-containing protein n=1 Tax=Sphaerisporangium perillae TaxID=2935860 RepID=UPI00243603D3|nr:DUF2218 domain-containing protein [Sphaerisporangium perillae]
MPSLVAQIETERPSRYLVQFCKHAAAMGGGGHAPRMHLHGIMARREVRVSAEWSDTHGIVTFTPWGKCTLAAEGNILDVRIEAADEDGLAQIQDVITRDLDRFSRRAPLVVTWQTTEAASVMPPLEARGTTLSRQGAPGWVRANLQTIVLVVAGALVLAVHLGLAGTILADSRWTGFAGNAVLAIVVLKVALIAVGRLRIHRRRAASLSRDSRRRAPHDHGSRR